MRLRCVCAPQYRSAGTSMSPIESLSRRVPLALIPIGTWRSTGCEFSLMLQPSQRLILGLVELTFDPGPDVARPLDLCEPLIEHELGDSGCGRHFRLQNVGLTRKQHAFGAQVRAHLIGTRLGRRDEAGVSEPPRSRYVGGETDRGEDVEVVGLSRVERLTIQRHI